MGIISDFFEGASQFVQSEVFGTVVVVAGCALGAYTIYIVGGVVIAAIESMTAAGCIEFLFQAGIITLQVKKSTCP
ncbi:Oidioi.mRNA.OKI2018_I69.chr2.g7393.t1.cds [Oikopleura dioica]|uniref:Oidioi.mRNA.OKI2018_I69.chr2.g7393.t1.cds n=1 Tax=Oikopleura dioica TaxID=34765 RepID=A0ABN7T724_OIKDI|nr:Oidioi.mRNA.OKI2018_I69.chr2.g7393.t1.cds [Oikopleura dioica]